MMRHCEHPLSRRIESAMPPMVPISLRSEADYYGASGLVKSAAGFRSTKTIRVGWQHGWANGPIDDPRQIIGRDQSMDHYLVANRVLAGLLNDHGFPATAVGLPLVYARPLAVSRLESSLLVMPAHTTHDSKHTASASEYIDFVVAQKANFEHVCVCVSKSCLEHGFWIDDFERAGIPWVTGAAIDDANALVRMGTLFSMFPTMTSNAIGSHFAYAAFHQCQVSLSGPSHQVTVEDLAGVGFYQENPDLIELAIHRSDRETISSLYPHLIREPEKAETSKSWADSELGWNCRKSADEMIDHFGLRWHQRIRRKIEGKVSRRFAGRKAA